VKRVEFALLSLLTFYLLFSGLSPSSPEAHPIQSGQKWTADSLQVLEGTVVCISEEMARLRHTKPLCKKYGHLLGLKLADGTIWSFFLNPVGRKIRNNPALLGKRLWVKGKLFYDAKVIDVQDFKVKGENKN